MKTRKAVISDVKEMHRLINESAKREEMLPRALNDLYTGIRDFVIYEEQDVIVGICALRIIWEDLAEIRSLIVREDFRNRGIGKQLVQQCLKEAEKLGIRRIFALTYVPGFFLSLGFRDIEKTRLPHKIWGDCLNCPKFPECDEHAVILQL